MTVPFNKIPSTTWRLPLFFAEVDNSRANTATTPQRTLLIGQLLATGSATPNIPVRCLSKDDAVSKCGAGSMLARMVEKYRGADPLGEMWILPVSDNGAAVVAAGSFAFTHIATANGVLSLYIAGRKVSLPVASTQTVAQLATALAALVNGISDLPVTAAVDGTNNFQVNWTAKNLGPIGNDFDVRVNYQGQLGGEATPAGLTFTIVAMSAGATAPVFTTALANLGDMPFRAFVFPYTDTTSLNAFKTFLDDTTGRWSFNRQLFGHGLACLRGSVGALQTAGLARNDQHFSVCGMYDTPTPMDEWSAATFGAAMAALRIDPGRPCQTLVVPGVLAPPLASRFIDIDRNSLLFSGISTFTVDDDGTVRIENLITTYQLNAFGQADNSYLEIETLFLLMFLLEDLRSLITTKYSRVKLAADGTRLLPGSGVVTPAILRADVVARYRLRESQGYCQNSDVFEQGLIMEKDATIRGRVNCLWPGDLIDQLRMFALLAQFRQS